MAARAYDVASFSLRSSSAHLNFPHLTASLPRPVSLAPRDIQTAAAAAAAAWMVPPHPGRADGSSLLINKSPAVKVRPSSVEKVAHEHAALKVPAQCTAHEGQGFAVPEIAERIRHTEVEYKGMAGAGQCDAEMGQLVEEEVQRNPMAGRRMILDPLCEDVLSNPWMLAEMAQALLLPLPAFLQEQPPPIHDHDHSFDLWLWD